MSDDEPVWTDLDLTDRLHEAKRAMPDVPKTGKAPESFGGFEYLEDKELTARAGPILNEWGLVVLPEMVDLTRDGKQTIIEWEMEIRARGTDETLKRTWYSEGKDGGDMGISKAATQARKDFQRVLLDVPGGAEVEDSLGGEHGDGSAHDDGNPTPSTDAGTDYKLQVIADDLTTDDEQLLRSSGLEKKPGVGWVIMIPNTLEQHVYDMKESLLEDLEADAKIRYKEVGS